jgi:hypothetical protein
MSLTRTRYPRPGTREMAGAVSELMCMGLTAWCRRDSLRLLRAGITALHPRPDAGDGGDSGVGTRKEAPPTLGSLDEVSWLGVSARGLGPDLRLPSAPRTRGFG